MAILLLFEKTDSLTCKEVQESLQLNSEQFGKHLLSLIESKLLLADMEVINMIVLWVYSNRSWIC
jgi:cullin 2